MARAGTYPLRGQMSGHLLTNAMQARAREPAPGSASFLASFLRKVSEAFPVFPVSSEPGESFLLIALTT